MNNIKQLFLLITICFVTSGCGSSYMYYATVNSANEINRVKSAIAEKKNPPRKAVQTNLNINVIGSEGWRLDAVAASPDNNYLALGMLDINSPLKATNGKLEVYTSFGRALKYSFNDKKLKTMIVSSSSAQYPDEIFAFHPYQLGFRDKNTLIALIQPQLTSQGDAIPLDVKMLIDVRTGKVVGTPDFFERTNRPILPVHAPNTRYNFEVINGEMHINNRKINGMPSNLHPTLHAETQL